MYIIIDLKSCIYCIHYSNGEGYCEPFCRHPYKNNRDYVIESSIPSDCPYLQDENAKLAINFYNKLKGATHQ